MSDYFTNLVTRSFSPEAAVQPLGFSPYVTAVAAENSFAEFSDPFAEAIKLEREIPETEVVTPERNSSRSKPVRLEAAIEATLAQSDQSVPAGLVANSRDDTITSSKTELPSEFAAVRDTYNPLPSNDTQPELQNTPLKRESTTSHVKRRPFNKLSEPAAPIQKELSTVVPGHRPSQKQRLKETSSAPLEPAASAEDYPQEKTIRAKQVDSKPTIVEHVTEREPIDAAVSTWRVVKKSVKANPISPRISSAHPTRSVLAPADKLQPIHARENVAPQQTMTLETVAEVSRSITPLVPKISTQSLLPVKIKSWHDVSSKQATYQSENRVLPDETIINVAIGRIEVRATPGESSKRERQLKGPRVMDLDEYARQRSRGNR
jgi:hypothetical protein